MKRHSIFIMPIRNQVIARHSLMCLHAGVVIKELKIALLAITISCKIII